MQRYGYTDWCCVDQDVDKRHWIDIRDYDGIIRELQAMKGELL